jgi:Glycosyl transferase family 2
MEQYRMSELPGVSIIIPNYNYERFIGEAIESALAQAHPDCEVIVVDDCSTDTSRSVIERYADRVQTVFLTKNGGQLAAINATWPLARHPILIFLDSDDRLVPHAASTIARAWAPKMGKVQFPMVSIDANGRPLGHVAPKYQGDLDTKTLREFILKTGGAPSTPGSGNAYAKWLLERLSPIEPAEGMIWLDPVLETNAPFYGEVLTLPEPLAEYRTHGTNGYQRQDLSLDGFARYISVFESKLAYVEKRAPCWGEAFDAEAAKRCSIWYTECLMAAAKLSPRGAPHQMHPLRVLGRALRAAPRSPHSVKQRAVHLAWLTAVTLAPRGTAENLIAYRFVIARRPRWLERAVKLLAR